MQLPFPSDAAPLGTAPAEDCLYLNVWRPAGTSPSAKLPVMFWIYGGGFVNGQADVFIAAEAIIERKKIFVDFIQVAAERIGAERAHFVAVADDADAQLG